MRTQLSILVLGILVLTIGTVQTIGIARKNVAPKELVYSMCQESRTTNNVSEETCGDLQDHFNMEYLCNERNSSQDNHCWVEVK